MAHIHEKVDFTAEVFVVCNNRVLLRKHDKYHLWLGVGGHIEPDEDPVQAAVREVKEEVGLDVRLLGNVPNLDEGTTGCQELLAPRFLNRHRITDTHEHVASIYFAVAETKAIHQGETEVSEATHWFTEKELDDPSYGIRDSIRAYAKAALVAAAGPSAKA